MPTEWRASKPVKQAAKDLRHNTTMARKRLWSVLRRRRTDGLRFRRQHPIGRFIVDFCCVDKRLVVEVDGGVHQFTVDYDVARQESLEACGYRVLRFTNEQIGENLDGVVEAIRMALVE